LRFLIDESTGRRLSEMMNEAGFDTVFVGDIMPGVDDEAILSAAEKEKRILITDDKDFGELVFRLNRPSIGVVLLRTSYSNPEKRLRLLLNLTKSHNLEHNFVTLSDDKIRIRKI
jgi:predicted nuclease of predicted toxin-antitoxin system